jgi:hypothetical protein
MNANNAEAIYLIIGSVSAVIWMLTYKFRNQHTGIGYANAGAGLIAFMIFATAAILLLAQAFDLIFPSSGGGGDPYCDPDPLFGGC